MACNNPFINLYHDICNRNDINKYNLGSNHVGLKYITYPDMRFSKYHKLYIAYYSDKNIEEGITLYIEVDE